MLSKTEKRLLNSFLGNSWITRDYTVQPHWVSTEQDLYRVQKGEGESTIVIPAPGVKKENISVSLEGRHLTVSCKSELDFGFQSFSNTFKVLAGTTEEHIFSNTFKVLAGTTEEHINASYEDGVLRVVIKEAEQESAARQIPVL
jgi:HSP20 family molecular chaperone IbpA